MAPGLVLPLYTVDAFADRPFRGNPAAVCLNERALGARLMQAIAAEMNLSETAFLVPRDDGDWDLRWFTPAAEVDLCGHATLASAQVVFEEVEPGRAEVVFHTRSGPLRVVRAGDLCVMDLPADPPRPEPPAPGLLEGLGRAPAAVLASRAHWLAVYDTEADVRALAPDFARLGTLDRKVIATAPCAGQADFVSRFFAPGVGVPEDPVTGSAHCTLTPYWAARLGRERLEGRQVSRRGGTLYLEPAGDRVRIAGRALILLRGELTLPPPGPAPKDAAPPAAKTPRGPRADA